MPALPKENILTSAMFFCQKPSCKLYKSQFFSSIVNSKTLKNDLFPNYEIESLMRNAFIIESENACTMNIVSSYGRETGYNRKIRSLYLGIKHFFINRLAKRT